ncbi:hypothetical protein Q5752_004382 [Cryptotrichosporon argae]
MSPLDVPPDLIGSSGLYNSPDPFLRRLRMDDQTGAPIKDVDRWFRHKDLVVVYAGSEQGINNVRELHSDLATLAIREHKNLAVLYVSSDTDPAAAARSTAQTPWVRMTFHDNSDFAPLASSDKAVVEEVSRGEDFVQAGEIDLGLEKVPFGAEEDPSDYVRPLSRAAVTMTMNAFSTPSLAIYHIPSHKFVARNVRPAQFNPNRVGTSLAKWRSGGAPAFGVNELVWAMRWPLFFAFIAVIYHVLVLVLGEEYNLIPHLLDQLNWRSR